MKIVNSTPLHPVQLLEKSKADSANNTEATSKPSAQAQSSKESSNVSRLNPGLTDSSFDIDNLRVEEVRQAILEGRLEISAERIADGLLDNLK